MKKGLVVLVLALCAVVLGGGNWMPKRPINIPGPLGGLSQRQFSGNIDPRDFVTAENVVNVGGRMEPRPGLFTAFIGESGAPFTTILTRASNDILELALNTATNPDTIYYINQASGSGNNSIRSVEVDGTDDGELLSEADLGNSPGVRGMRSLEVDAVGNDARFVRLVGRAGTFDNQTILGGFGAIPPEPGLFVINTFPSTAVLHTTLQIRVGGGPTAWDFLITHDTSQVVSDVFITKSTTPFTTAVVSQVTGIDKYKMAAYNQADTTLYVTNSDFDTPDGTTIHVFRFAGGAPNGFPFQLPNFAPPIQESITAEYNISDIFYQPTLRRLYYTTDGGTTVSRGVYVVPVLAGGSLGTQFRIASFTAAGDVPRGIVVDSAGNVYVSNNVSGAEKIVKLAPAAGDLAQGYWWNHSVVNVP